MRLAFSLGLVAFVAGITGCGMSWRDEIDIHGSIKADRYTPLNKVYSCPVPRLMKPGSHISDEVSTDEKAGAVSFRDDLGTWINVVHMPIPEGFSDRATREEYLEKFLSGGSSDAVLYEEDIAHNSRMNRIAIVKFPEASFLVDQATGTRFDLVEGILVFGVRDYLFRISISDTRDLLLSRPIELDDRVEHLRPRLFEFYDGMRFFEDIDNSRPADPAHEPKISPG